MNFLPPDATRGEWSPDDNEIASLAFKFYQDGNCEDGHDRENWLCAEYMLAQKRLIERQIDALHQGITLSLSVC